MDNKKVSNYFINYQYKNNFVHKVILTVVELCFIEINAVKRLYI